MVDNRDTLMAIGKLISKGDRWAGRDAVHIAVIPLEAREALAPGDFVSAEGFWCGPSGGSGGKPVGIVDPFLPVKLRRGDLFWCFLMPGSITSLRHVWTHDAFDGDEAYRERGGVPAADEVLGGERATAVAWLKVYAEEIDTGYRSLMQAAENWVEYGEWYSEGGKFEGVATDDRFWDYWETATGKSVPEIKRHSFFSCSC